MAELLAEMFLGMQARSPVKLAWNAILELKQAALAAVPRERVHIENHFARLQTYYFANSRQTLLRMKALIPAEVRTALQNPTTDTVQAVLSTSGEQVEALSVLLGSSVFQICSDISVPHQQTLRARASAVIAALDRL